MKISKKVLSVLLAVLLLASCMVTAFAVSGTDGNITWNYDEATKTLTISGTGDMPDYDVYDPAWYIYNWNTLTNNYLFEIEHLIIENGVTNIGGHAFAHCESLKSVTIPNSVTRIGERAFAYCTALTSVTIPDSVTSIGDYAFTHCTALTSVTIPSSVTSIGKYEFSVCTALTSVTISDSVTSIGFSAFYGCSALTEVNYTGSEAEWNNIAFGNDALPQGVTVNYNYAPAPIQPENACPWCGQVHEGFFQGIIGFFHRIFAAILGARY